MAVSRIFFILDKFGLREKDSVETAEMLDFTVV